MPFCFVRATDGWQRQREEGGQQVIYLRQVQAVGTTNRGGAQCTDNEINMFVLC